MKYCDKCKLSIRGGGERCPLCQGILEGSAEEKAVFPVIPLPNRIGLFVIRILIFLSVAAAVSCTVINLVLTPQYHWFWFVISGLACLWLEAAVILRKYHDVPKTILWQVIVISLLAVVWDLGTGWHRWSVEFVMPVLCCCAMAGMAIVAKFLKVRAEDFILYLMLDALFALISLALLVSGIVEAMAPSFLCIAGAVISLAALILFQGETMWAEIRKRLHL